MAVCTGTPSQCPITFDPFYVIGGVNQNHPANVAAGCGEQFVDDPSWVKVDGFLLQGMFWTATAHGKGKIRACNADETVCTDSSFEVDH
jgi:hypothetical protein